MPIDVLKWICNWFQGRSFCIHYGNECSRNSSMTLFRLYIHFLYKYIDGTTFRLFVDDLVLIFSGALEKKFSKNISDLETLAALGMTKLEQFFNDYLLPVNVGKIKCMLIHSIVSPPYPKMSYQSQDIEFVKNFKYLGVNITVKFGWSRYISDRLKKMRMLFHTFSGCFVHGSTLQTTRKK